MLLAASDDGSDCTVLLDACPPSALVCVLDAELLLRRQTDLLQLKSVSRDGVGNANRYGLVVM